MLPDMFIHFKLWINKREGVVPCCLVPMRQGKKRLLFDSFTCLEIRGGTRFDSLYGTQYPHATDVRVFAVHVVREDDDLEDVRVYRFA